MRTSTCSLLLVLSIAACKAPIADAPCPCGAGFTCCEATSTCVAEGAECGSGRADDLDDAGGADAPVLPPDAAQIDPDGAHTRYVVSRLAVPTSLGESSTFALDIAGTSATDNALGNLLATLETLGIDSGAAVDLGIASGAVIHLIDVQATDLVNAGGAGLRMFDGADPTPAPCDGPVSVASCGDHLLGDGTFSIAPGSPTDSQVVGAIANGVFRGGPGKLHVALTLGSAPIPLALEGARAELPVAPGVEGRIGGGVRATDAEETVLPGLCAAINERVAAGCDGVPGACCPAGSTLDGILDLLDGDGDCSVTPVELGEMPVIQATLLNPDLDLFDGDVFSPDTDGIKDALSIGLGVTLAPAGFEAP